MNNTMALWFLKDLKTLKRLVLAWAVLLVARTASSVMLLQSWDDPHLLDVMQPLAILMLIGTALFSTLLVVALLQTDNLIDSHAFWRTQPVSPAAILGSKIAFILLIVVVPAALVPIGINLAYDCPPLSGHHATLALVLVLTLFGLLLGSITRTVPGAVLLGLSAFVALAFAGAIFSRTHPSDLIPATPNHASMGTSRVTASLVLLAVSFLFVWIAQTFRPGTIRRPILLLCTAAALVVVCSKWWPWDFLSIFGSPQRAQSALADGEGILTFDKLTVATGETERPGIGRLVELHLRDGADTTSPVPRFKAAVLSATANDGAFPVFVSAHQEPRDVIWSSSDFQQALPPCRLAENFHAANNICRVVLLHADVERAMASAEGLHLRVLIEGSTQRLVEAIRVPLKPGARASRGHFDIRLADISITPPHALTIRVFSRSLRAAQYVERQETQWVIMNPARAEIVRLQRYGGSWIDIGVATIGRAELRLDRNTSSIDEPWLSGAFLVALRAEPAGPLRRIEIDKQFHVTRDAHSHFEFHEAHAE